MKYKLVTFLVMILVLAGCSNNEIGLTSNGNNLVNEIEINEDLDIEKIIESIKTKFDLEDNEAIEIIKLDKDLYLIGEKYQHVNYLNYMYSVYDRKVDELSEIGRIYQLIESIYLEDGKIIFKCNGKNSETTFLDFPDTYMYNLENKKLKVVNDYTKFGEEYNFVSVGGHHNATLLTEVEHNLDSLILKFGKHETSILAGGNFAPNIKIKTNKENQLSLNIDNIFLDESQFDDLLNSAVVDNIEFIYYNDIDNKNHTIIKIKFNKARSRNKLFIVFFWEFPNPKSVFFS